METDSLSRLLQSRVLTYLVVYMWLLFFTQAHAPTKIHTCFCTDRDVQYIYICMF